MGWACQYWMPVASGVRTLQSAMLFSDRQMVGMECDTRRLEAILGHADGGDRL